MRLRGFDGAPQRCFVARMGDGGADRREPMTKEDQGVVFLVRSVLGHAQRSIRFESGKAMDILRRRLDLNRANAVTAERRRNPRDLCESTSTSPSK
jgi:hypothetical protein